MQIKFDRTDYGIVRVLEAGAYHTVGLVHISEIRKVGH